MKFFVSFTFWVSVACHLGIMVAQPSIQAWERADQSTVSRFQERLIKPQKELLFRLDESIIRQALEAAPEEFSPEARLSPLLLSLPTPNGEIQTFSVVHSPIVEEGLQQKYPDIRTYSAKGLSDPTAIARLDLTPAGFHGIILTSTGTIFIDPYSPQSTVFYSCYYTHDYQLDEEWQCEFTLENDGHSHTSNDEHSRAFGDCQFRSYRLALAATGEYTAFHGGKSQAVAAQITTMNRVNSVMERDLAIRLIIIANNDVLVYTNPSTDPYTNNNGGIMLGQNQSNIDAVIGSANYDLGHVFSTGGGGIASLGSLCSSFSKARGVTGLGSPVGDPFDIDFVAHEIGHQLGGNHTFNGTSGACQGNGVGFAAFEPGSGTTIQAYAGICTGQNVQSNSDDYYHAFSLEEMANVIVNTSCATIIGSTNNPPTVSHGPLSFVIPANTPFFLESAGSDMDGDSLTYCWEQFDNEASQQPPVSTSTGGPLFRSLQPTPNPRRYFPSLPNVLFGSNSPWQVLPSVSREMNFRVTVRDNVIGGCTDSEDAFIEVNGDSGPFSVLQPNTFVSWIPGTYELVEWDVANTTAQPVNTPNVDIYLSLDGGFTYPVQLASQVPNNGSFLVQVPDTNTTSCRVMVQGSGNIFYDVSDQNFQINLPSQPGFAIYWPDTSVVACIEGEGSISFLSTGWQGQSDSISFAFSSLPQGVSTSVMSNPVIPGDSAQLIFHVDSTANAGIYSIGLVANSGSAAPEAQILQLEIQDNIPDQLTAISPTSGASGISTNTSFNWVNTPTALSYQIEIATSPTFGSTTIFSQAGLPTPGFVLPTPLTPGDVYYWRVRGENTCGSGPFSQVFGFQIAECIDSMSVDVPQTIPLFGTTREIISEISIVSAGLVSDVNVVGLSGTHTEISELTVSLINSSATEVVLFSGICNPGDQDFSLNFDDQAILTTPNCPPIDNGVYQAEGNLSDFHGQQAFGIWQLKIEDAENFNNGDLLSWGLEICTGSDILPELIQNTGLTTVQWNLDTINSLLLEAQDLVSGPEDLTFTIVELPTHGGLLLDGVNLFVGDNFTQEDIDLNRFTYLNNGDSAVSDAFRFDVRNASGGWIGVFTFPIEIQLGITSIQNLHNLIDVSVYPNPAQDQLFIELEGKWIGDIDIKMSNIQGQLLYREGFQKQSDLLSKSIRVDNWASGIYLLEIQTVEGRVWKKVMIE